MSLFTPVNQIRLTNVATVKLQKKGKRFEIACYRNKVLSWRNKVETSLSEVLQIDSIFTNVSKGMLASAKDLVEVFGTSDHQAICKEILDKGELQVSEQERIALHESIFKDIASIVADKTVNPETNRPYTVNMIQNAMKQIQFSVNTTKSSKSQALEVIRKLKDVMPIARANMLLKIVFTIPDTSALLECIQSCHAQIHTSSMPIHALQEATLLPSPSSAEQYMDIIIDPEHFRRVEETVAALPSGTGRVDVLQMRMVGNTSVGEGVAGAIEAKPIAVETSAASELSLLPPVPPAKEKKGNVRADGKDSRVRGSQSNDLASLLVEMGAIDEEDGDVVDAYSPPPTASSSKANKKSKKKEKGIVASDTADMSLADSTDNSVATAALLPPAPPKAVKMKVSKKSKREERAEAEERAEQAKLLHDRISHEKHTKQQVVLPSAEDTTSAPLSLPDDGSSPSNPIGGAGKKCTTCGGAFADAQAFREHFKSEWHRFNLKRKMKNLPIVPSEEAFLALSVEELQI